MPREAADQKDITMDAQRKERTAAGEERRLGEAEDGAEERQVKEADRDEGVQGAW